MTNLATGTFTGLIGLVQTGPGRTPTLGTRSRALAQAYGPEHRGTATRLNYLIKPISIITLILVSVTIYNICGASPVSAADESLSVSISGNPTVDIAPNSEGTFADSGNVTIGVTTTNATGYNLSIAAQDSTNLKGKNDNTQIISTLESAVSPNDFSTSQTYNNKWGYKPSQYYNTNTQTVIPNTNYLPSPTTSGTTLDVTSAAGSKNYTMSIGARVTNATKFDEYSNTFVVTAIANVVPLTVVFDANGGSFSGGGTTNTMGVKMNCMRQQEAVTKYSHTPNVSDAGVARTTYSNNSDITDTVTIDGADTLEVTIYYDAQSASSDWVSVYQGPFNISTSNDATISASTGNLSGKLSSSNSNRTTDYSTWYSKTYTIAGDTVKFHFISDSKYIYYGYYAIITGKPMTCDNTVTSGTYKKPAVADGRNFVGWAANSTSTTSVYGPDINLTTENLGENDSAVTLYAVYLPYIQDFTNAMCQEQATNTPVTVADKRDNNQYTVRYINGNCWMTQNLRFGGSTLEPTTSDVSQERTIAWQDLVSDSDCRSSIGGAADYTPCKIYNTGNDATYYNYVGVTAGTFIGDYTGDGYSYESICPAGWQLPTSSQFSGVTSYKTALSLDYTGAYYQGNFMSSATRGYWWSSSVFSNGYSSYALIRYGDNGDKVVASDGPYRFEGIPVRCVARGPWMQDINEWGDNLSTGSSVPVSDRRDNKTYTVAKLTDGNIWMTQNLRFEGSTLKPDTSDVKQERTIEWKDLVDDADCKGTSNDSVSMSTSCKHYDNSTDVGVYYNYAGASAGTITGSSNTTDASESICPAGWTLPTYDQQSSAVNNGSTFFQNYVGYYSGGSKTGTATSGSTTYWWSSTAKDATYRHSLMSYHNYSAGYSRPLSVVSSTRYQGKSVRCVWKK